MEIVELLRVVLRRWWLILLPLLLSAVIAIPEFLRTSNASQSGFNARVSYSAAQRFNLPERSGDYTDVWLASEYTVDAMTEWVRSSSFRAEIHTQLAGSNTDLGSLQIAADNVRNVGVIYFSHRNQESLRAIVDAALVVLTSRSQFYFPQLGGDSAQVTILDQSAINAAPPPLTNRFAPLIRLGIAFLIGVALALFAEYADQTIYHQDDLRRLGIRLLGSVPRDRA
ncbi:MAG: hypothetical protein F4X02_00630 [Chloroflexi bacterium]|nr:hypothetical protein [Chloroflexota bacterium]